MNGFVSCQYLVCAMNIDALLHMKDDPDRVTLAMNFLILEAQPFNHTANAKVEIWNDCLCEFIYMNVSVFAQAGFSQSLHQRALGILSLIVFYFLFF